VRQLSVPTASLNLRVDVLIGLAETHTHRVDADVGYAPHLPPRGDLVRPLLRRELRQRYTSFDAERVGTPAAGHHELMDLVQRRLGLSAGPRSPADLAASARDGGAESEAREQLGGDAHRCAAD
jgi:hypothetical protein